MPAPPRLLCNADQWRGKVASISSSIVRCPIIWSPAGDARLCSYYTKPIEGWIIARPCKSDFFITHPCSLFPISDCDLYCYICLQSMSVKWYYRNISMQILFNIPFIVCLHAERRVTESNRLGKGYSSFSAKQTTNTQSKLRVIDC